MATTGGHYQVEILTPVHIGTGDAYTPLDGVYADGRWHRLDIDRVVGAGADARQLAREMSLPSFDWVTILRRYQIALASATASGYPVPCAGDPGNTPVRPFLRDVSARPYLPGSSLKGPMRTAIFAHLARARPSELARAVGNARQPRESGRRRQVSREWLTQPVERFFLGNTPNYDLMRAVQVADSEPFPVDALEITPVWTYTLRAGRMEEKRDGGEYKVFVEQLRPGGAAKVSLHIDEFLFSPQANRELCFAGAMEEAVRSLAGVCNARARSLLERELGFARQYGPARVVRAYEELLQRLADLPPGAFLLNLGWGGGWECKTLGELLREVLGDQEFARLREQFRLGRSGQPFPKTRRYAYRGGAPTFPLGWVSLTPA